MSRGRRTLRADLSGRNRSRGRGRGLRSTGRDLPFAAGFTLVEVLVALVIVALVLGAAMRATGMLTTTQEALTKSTMAAWSAENRLAELRIAHVLPPVGQSSSACPQADLALVCSVEVGNSPNPGMRRVDVEVAGTDDPRHVLARRMAFLSALP